jgi:pSer/pThr/pTyr-binding forkhead associated (FHA) protein
VDRIIIEFLNGSRAGLVEVYPAARFASLYLGRDAKCDVRLDTDADTMVSRNHAVIEWVDEDSLRRYTLSDLLSSNGTYLNGERVLGTVALRSEDVLRLGAQGPEFRIRIERPVSNVENEVTQSIKRHP